MPKTPIKFAAGLIIFFAAVSLLMFKARLATAPPQPTNKVSQDGNAAPDKQQILSAHNSFDKLAHSLSDPSSIWVVVNKTRPLNPTDYAPSDLVAVGGGQKLRQEAASAFRDLQTAAKSANLSIGALSGYRSYATQVSVYANEVKNFGRVKADAESARPGTSEHQTGWAVDVGGGGCGIEDCFGNTDEGKWLAKHAYEFGFIIRYTTDKQHVTGYRAEPWHIRYIGIELANEMQRSSIATLEEFFGLPAAPDYPK